MPIILIFSRSWAHENESVLEKHPGREGGRGISLEFCFGWLNFDPYSFKEKEVESNGLVD